MVHCTVQAPLEQTWVTEQTLPQTPQCCVLVWVLTQPPPQLLKPVLQVMPHVPPVQLAVPFGGTGQLAPQAPQCCVLLEVFWQLPPQSV